MRLPPAAYVVLALFVAAVVSAALSPSPATIAIVVSLVVLGLAGEGVGPARLRKRAAMRPPAPHPPVERHGVATLSDASWRRQHERRRSHR